MESVAEGDRVGELAAGGLRRADEGGMGRVGGGDGEEGEGVGAGVDGEEALARDEDGVLGEKGVCRVSPCFLSTAGELED